MLGYFAVFGVEEVVPSSKHGFVSLGGDSTRESCGGSGALASVDEACGDNESTLCAIGQKWEFGGIRLEAESARTVCYSFTASSAPVELVFKLGKIIRKTPPPIIWDILCYWRLTAPRLD